MVLDMGMFDDGSGARSPPLEDTTGSLEDTTGSLEDTTGSLEDTAGSLEDTAGTLAGVVGPPWILAPSDEFGGVEPCGSCREIGDGLSLICADADSAGLGLLTEGESGLTEG